MLTLIISVASPVHAQFWKKKKYHTKASTNKASRPSGNKYRDSFASKPKKGPNVKTTRKPIIKTKKKMHKHATSRKTKKPGRSKFFTKNRIPKSRLQKRSGDSFRRNARKTKKNSSKGGGSGNGVFKGRKK